MRRVTGRESAAALAVALAMGVATASAQEPPESSPAAQPAALPPLAAPGELPAGVPASATAPEVRIGRFFDVPFDGSARDPGDPAPARAYEIIPTLTGRLFATDNAFPGSSRGRADLITSIIPGLTVTADSARIVGRASYTPSIVLHANGSGENRVDHRFLGAGTISLVPGSVFLDLRGTASVTPIGGGLTSDLPETFPRRDTAQTLVASASPYWINRFGSAATSILGYSFTYATRQGDTARLTPGGLPFFRPSDFTAHTGFAALRSGEDFGRLAVEARVRGTLFEGTGTLDNAHRALGIVEGRYAVTRTLQLLLEGGYEDIAFNGTPRFRVSEPVWGLGLRLDPGPNTTIIARYRRRDGFDAPQLTARVGLGARLLLFARYDDRLQTQLVRTADLLETVSFDELGNPVDSRSGAPVPEIGGTGLLSQQNGLFRTRRGQASLTWFLERDTFTLSFTHEQRRVVALDPGTLAFGQESSSAGIIWTRALSDRTGASAQFQYGRFSTPGLTRDSDGYTFRATLRHQLSDTLSGSIQYQLTNRSTTLAPFGTQLSPSGAVQNALIATLSKRF